MKRSYGMGLGIALLFVGGCGGKSNSAGSASTELADAISLIEAGVTQTGNSLGGATMLNSAQTPSRSLFSSKFEFSPMSITPFTSAMCDIHGRPQSAGSDMSQSAEAYPYAHTYCALTTNDGDTVRGGFGLARGLICSLEKGGIEFAGATQSIAPDFTDTDCWPNGGPGGPGETPTGIVMSAVGSAPASFNSYFEKGVVFSVPVLGLTLSIAANLDGNKIEFISRENWDGTNAGDSLGNIGVMSGSIDKTTGVLKFEKRDERIRSTCTTSNCAFNRHTRLIANLALNSNHEPESLNSFQYGYADTQISAATLSSGSDASATVVTAASDSIDSEIKARFFSVSGKTATQISTIGTWSSAETTNTACGSSGGVNDAANCSTQAAPSLFTANTKFLLRGGQESVANWASNFAGFNFTTVNLDVDTAY